MSSLSCLRSVGSKAAAGTNTVRHPVSCSVLRQLPSHRKTACRAKEAVDMEAQVEEFMRRQAELESGIVTLRERDPNTVIGADVVNDETAKLYCAEIFEALKALRKNRDMSVAEVKLVVSIEDPAMKERRKAGLEDERGVSRHEMAQALVDIAEGRIPNDRIALQCLHEEIADWPFLEATLSETKPKGASEYAKAVEGGEF